MLKHRQSVNDETTIAKTASYCQWKLICVLQVKICSEHLQLSMVSSCDFLFLVSMETADIKLNTKEMEVMFGCSGIDRMEENGE